MLGQAEKRPAHFRIVLESLCSINQPQIQLIFEARASETSSV